MNAEEKMDDLNFDEIINANMTVTDHRLRDGIHAVMVDLLHAVRESCAKVCEEQLYEEEASNFDHGYNRGVKACITTLRGEEE